MAPVRFWSKFEHEGIEGNRNMLEVILETAPGASKASSDGNAGSQSAAHYFSPRMWSVQTGGPTTIHSPDPAKLSLDSGSEGATGR